MIPLGRLIASWRRATEVITEGRVMVCPRRAGTGPDCTCGTCPPDPRERP